MWAKCDCESQEHDYWAQAIFAGIRLMLFPLGADLPACANFVEIGDWANGETSK